MPEVKLLCDKQTSKNPTSVGLMTDSGLTPYWQANGLAIWGLMPSNASTIEGGVLQYVSITSKRFGGSQSRLQSETPHQCVADARSVVNESQ